MKQLTMHFDRFDSGCFDCGCCGSDSLLAKLNVSMRSSSMPDSLTMAFTSCELKKGSREMDVLLTLVRSGSYLHNLLRCIVHQRYARISTCRLFVDNVVDKSENVRHFVLQILRVFELLGTGFADDAVGIHVRQMRCIQKVMQAVRLQLQVHRQMIQELRG